MDIEKVTKHCTFVVAFLWRLLDPKENYSIWNFYGVNDLRCAFEESEQIYNL